MRGPPPTPTAIKKAKGNPGHRPLNRNEPTPTPGTPQPPANLEGNALAGWNKLVTTLAPTRVLTDADWLVLAMTADAYGRWVDSIALVAQTGGPVLTTRDGNVSQNPAVWERNKAFDELRRLLPSLGLTPADRSRLTVAPAAEAEDDFFKVR